MIRLILITSTLFTALIGFSQVEDIGQQDVEEELYTKTPYVNPFIGTGGHGHTYPGAAAPFGMVQLSPDTRHTGWDGCSGYHYSDSIIYGFSHTHLSGTGVSDYGDLLIVPQAGKAKIEPGYSSTDGYGAEFSHASEMAAPGYYYVGLKNGIHVNLAATERCGIHHYAFINIPDEEKHILIDLDHRDRVISADIEALNKTTVVGHRVSNSWASEQHFYFYLETSVPYSKAKYITKNGKHKLLLTFPKSSLNIFVRVGISAVDIDGAQKNLEKEIPHWSVNTVRERTIQQWEKELNKIDFFTEDQEVMTNFYTALYHAYLAPNVFNDVDGRYRGRDLAIHSLDPKFERNYTVFSLWDTYRATHPLYTITQQQKTNDFISTFLRQYDQGGDLPVWELAANETECMIGYHSVSVIADAYLKGLRDFDVEKAIEAVVATSNFDEYGKRHFAKNGFIGTGDEPESVSKTLEYAYDDFCIAQFLTAAQKDYDVDPELIDAYQNRSFNFLNVFDPSTKFMRGRRNGQWFSPFDPAEVNFNYTEANSWQYSLYAPHAIEMMTKAIGGKDSLEAWLDRLFTTEFEISGRHQADITGLIGQYAHGNEPSHHMAYLYNYTNAPFKTQEYVDQILREMYSTKPDGLSGNEDCGQMSSWYVLSALGIYQVAPGTPYYDFGRPMMDQATLNLENGKSLTINCINNSIENKYIQHIDWNGEPWTKRYIGHDQLMKGGILTIAMGESPAKNQLEEILHARGEFENLPSSFVPVPYFEQENRVFDDSIQLSLNILFPSDYEIHYTLDGTEPTRKSPSSEEPFWISSNTTVKAIAMSDVAMSSIISNDFVKRDAGISLELKSEYANQYAADGKYSLIDGIRGNNEYRTGDWQGYWAQDIVAEVNFDSPRELNSVGIGCLSDMKSWIFLPKEVIIEGSFDGINFTEIGSIKEAIESKDQLAPHHVNYEIKTKTSIPYRAIRVVVKNAGKCPEWHLGDGNDTWLFVDEIILR